MSLISKAGFNTVRIIVKTIGREAGETSLKGLKVSSHQIEDVYTKSAKELLKDSGFIGRHVKIIYLRTIGYLKMAGQTLKQVYETVRNGLGRLLGKGKKAAEQATSGTKAEATQAGTTGRKASPARMTARNA